MSYTVLIVDDEKHTREGLSQALEEEYDTYLAASADEAFRLMKDIEFDVVLTDLRMAGKSGMRVIDHAFKLPYRPICIMMTAYGTVESAVEAMKRGAFDFLTKPVNLEQLEVLIKRAIQDREAVRVNQPNLEEPIKKNIKSSTILSSSQSIIGDEKVLKNILTKIEQVAPTKATVLLLGETGTGKELFANRIHQSSDRADKPFVPVHCAAIPSNLLESELFGHEKGAFTGAVEKRIGRFELADKGTLFLDEIGEIDSTTQVKLLRFLETRTLERLGSTTPVKVDVRLVCATNKNLKELVAAGEFREDLYYRLNVVEIDLPSLRDRKNDIPELIDYYLEQFSLENKLEKPQLSSSAVDVLKNYFWPGNVRELRNFCENASIMYAGKVIQDKDLDYRFHVNEPAVKTKQLSRSVQEKEMIRNALKESQGNKTKAAEILGINRRTLHRKLAQWSDMID